jgi:hypothetical protein
MKGKACPANGLAPPSKSTPAGLMVLRCLPKQAQNQQSSGLGWAISRLFCGGKADKSLLVKKHRAF